MKFPILLAVSSHNAPTTFPYSNNNNGPYNQMLGKRRKKMERKMEKYENAD